MKIFSFLIATFVYIICVGVAVFLLSPDSFTLQSPFFEYTLPTYLWVMSVVGLYGIFVLLHFGFYGMKIYLKKSAIDSDKNKFIKYIKDLALLKTKSVNFKSEYYKQMQSYINDLILGTSDDEELKAIFEIKARLESGEVVNLSPFNISKTNPLYIKNEENKAKQDLSYAKKVVKNITMINNDLESCAYMNLLTNGSYDDIKSLKIKKSSKDIFMIFSRFDELKLSNVAVENLLIDEALSQDDILVVLKMIISKIEPTPLINLMKKLKDSDEKYLRGYFYALAYFADYDTLSVEYAQSQKNYDDFKLLMFLRDKSQKFDINDIIK